MTIRGEMRKKIGKSQSDLRKLKKEERDKKIAKRNEELKNKRKNPYHRKHGDEAEKKRIDSMSHLSNRQKRVKKQNIDAGTPGKSITASSKTKNRSKLKTLTKAQIRFKEREAKGLSGLTGGKKGETIAEYRARQKKQVQDAARERNKKFKEERKYKKTGTAKKVGNMFKRTGILAEDKGKKQGSKKKVGNMFKRTGLFK